MEGLLKHKTQAEVSLTKLEQQAYTCLLLDVSGSMVDLVGEGEEASRKIDTLRLLADRFNIRQFVFSSTCYESRAIPEPSGGTDLAYAFRVVKSQRIKKVVLITDGLPNSEESALNEALGLEVDIYYVGPEPRPDFLNRLASLTKGLVKSGQLLEGKLDEIERTVAGLIEGRVDETIQA
jgi:hypothetical protein